jgi:hypothetical protein
MNFQLLRRANHFKLTDLLEKKMKWEIVFPFHKQVLSKKWNGITHPQSRNSGMLELWNTGMMERSFGRR